MLTWDISALCLRYRGEVTYGVISAGVIAFAYCRNDLSIRISGTSWYVRYFKEMSESPWYPVARNALAAPIYGQIACYNAPIGEYIYYSYGEKSCIVCLIDGTPDGVVGSQSEALAVRDPLLVLVSLCTGVFNG